MNKKYNKLVAIMTLSLSGVLPLVTLNNKTLAGHDNQSKSITNTAISKRVNNDGRKVHKFTGLHSRNDQNLFRKLQDQLTTTNINIELNSTSNYNYAIKYDNYDVFHAEHKGLVSYIDNTKSTNNSINVGIKLFDKMSIYISKNNITKNSQKNWKSLKLNSLAKLDFKKVDPASVFYSVSASGTKSSPTVTISRSYTSRDSKTTNSQIFGYFNVNNINHNAKYFFKHPGGIATIIAVIALVLIALAVIVFARVGYVKYKNLQLFFNTKSGEVFPWKIEEGLFPQNLEEPNIFETQGVGDGNPVIPPAPETTGATGVGEVRAGNPVIPTAPETTGATGVGEVRAGNPVIPPAPETTLATGATGVGAGNPVIPTAPEATEVGGVRAGNPVIPLAPEATTNVDKNEALMPKVGKTSVDLGGRENVEINLPTNPELQAYQDAEKQKALLEEQHEQRIEARRIAKEKAENAAKENAAKEKAENAERLSAFNLRFQESNKSLKRFGKRFGIYASAEDLLIEENILGYEDTHKGLGPSFEAEFNKIKLFLD